MNKPGIFTLVVLAAGIATGKSAIVLNEQFPYADGMLTSVSGGAWVTHSGTAGQVDVAGNKVNIVSSESEDVSTPIAGPGLFYNSGVLTATFDVNFSALPNAAGGYFAHFKDGGVANFRGRVFATTTGAATGSFRLGIADTTNTFVAIPTDLALATLHSVILSLNTATGRSSLSVNGGTAVVATDATSLLNISTFAFRQSAGEGTLTADNLIVDASAAAVPEPSTALSLIGGLGILCGFRRIRARGQVSGR